MAGEFFLITKINDMAKYITVKVSENCSLAGKKLSIKKSKEAGMYLGTVCKKQASKRSKKKK